MTVKLFRQILAILGVSSALVCLLRVPGSASEAKLRPEDVVAGNLASIGTAEARAAARNRNIGAAAQMGSRLGEYGALSGRGIILSEGHNIRMGMEFPTQVYSGDQIAFDGSKVTVGQMRPGERSTLSSFIYQYDGLVREGLLGGSLTVAWALLDLAQRQPKLDYAGLKKVEGKQLHELKYQPKRSMGELTMALYFEPGTYRHVRSQYRLVKPASMVSDPDASAGQRDAILKITEDFSDFKAVDGLTLPHAYKLNLTIEGQTSTFMADWTLLVSKIMHNQEIDPKLFIVRIP